MFKEYVGKKVFLPTYFYRLPFGEIKAFNNFSIRLYLKLRGIFESVKITKSPKFSCLALSNFVKSSS